MIKIMLCTCDLLHTWRRYFAFKCSPTAAVKDNEPPRYLKDRAPEPKDKEDYRHVKIVRQRLLSGRAAHSR